MKKLLKLENVSMHFNLPKKKLESSDYLVFEGINFSLSEGECVGLVGRNGSGKSTLLKIMAGIYAPSSGRVVWSQRVSVSLLSLGLGFRPDLTGRENAFLSCLLQGLSKAEARDRLIRIEAFADLGKFFGEPMHTFSTGMRARLGFATSLVNRSKIILIDEVLSVGDKKFREKARSALKEELSKHRAAVIVSHIDDQIKRSCGRCILLNEGSIVADGDSTRVLAEYAALAR